VFQWGTYTDMDRPSPGTARRMRVIGAGPP
jgi:hypothetical protein